MIVIGCDPGTHESALVQWDGGRILYADTILNEAVLAAIGWMAGDVFACEWVENFGKPAGQEMFRSVWWVGRFRQRCEYSKMPPIRYEEVTRRAVKLHICQSSAVKDGNVRQALIDRFGGSAAIGKKANQGPLYGLSGHTWSAFAVALTWHDQHAGEVS